MPLIPLDAGCLPAVAHLHVQALAGDFLPSLGEGFLRVFYRAALRSGLAFGFVYLDPTGRVSGFVLGSEDTSALFRKIVVRSGLVLGAAALPAVMRRPGLLQKVAETFLYPSREAEAAAIEKAELLVIAVSPEARSRGLGAELVQVLNENFKQRGIRSYKVTVLEGNSGANRFYQRMGFRAGGQFILYRKKWNLYTFNLRERVE